MPISIEEIEDSAFENCSKSQINLIADGIEDNRRRCIERNRLADHRDSKSVFWLGDGLVADCQSMEHVTIPENIGRIPDRMFEGCTSLKKVEVT